MKETLHINDGGPAFPRDSKWNLDGSFLQRGHIGMSLRDWFAGQALVGWTATGPSIDGFPADMTRLHADKIALGCYRYADAMIAARKVKEL